jgi:tetratricopeptide (TPR) repeat protein/predicted Ser/Thr protein kinase
MTKSDLSEDTVPIADPSPAPADRDGSPGATIGRFVVLGSLGRGGMGVVLSAYDPLLDRKVALKLLRPDVWSGRSESEGRARLQREAQAMAKLSHSNVVTVYEVGTVGEQQFIAMEFVDGQTLSAWLRHGARDWREIVRRFVAAGRGLQAAHAAGLVHRDFKPENVLIGSDGRPRVGDFGLVSGVRSSAGDRADELGATRAGAIMGTPGYMSPEQMRGEATNAQSDQFSFCVALYEALHQERAFPDDEPEAQREAVLSGRVRPSPRKSGLPARLTEALLRGLRVDPAERWPSMEVLLDALERDPTRQRRRRLMATVALATVLVGAGGLAKWIHDVRASVCSGASARLRAVWDDERRQKVQRAFAATGLGYASNTFARVAALLDRYAGAWVSMHEEACRATRVEGRQSDSLLDLRMACLERHRATLAALTEVWAGGVDGSAVENALAAASSLPPVNECADARVLAERVPLPRQPAAVARIEAVRQHLDRLRALAEAKRLREARAEAEVARRDADATAFAPVQAEAAFLVGRIARGFGEPGAVEPLEEAAKLAASARDDRLAAAALDEAIIVLGEQRGAQTALELAPVVEAFVARAGNRPEQRAALAFARGAAYEDLGKYGEARAALSEARALYTQSLGSRDPLTLGAVLKLALIADASGDYASNKTLSRELLPTAIEVLGPDHPQMAIILRHLAMFAQHAGERARARELAERALAIGERAFGPTAMETARIVNTVGVIAEADGRLDEADRCFERVLAIRRQQLAPDHPLIAHVLANLTIIRRRQGRLEEAQSLIERALAIMTKTYGPMHADVAHDLGTLADVLAERGDVAGARAQYQRSLAIWNQIKGPEHLDTLTWTSSAALFYARVGSCADARELATPAIATIEKVAGPHNPWLVDLWMATTECDLQDGAAAAAVPVLERAMSIAEEPEATPIKLAEVRFDLARALRAIGGDGARVSQLAAAAEKEFTQAGHEGSRNLRRLRAWRREDEQTPKE